MKKAVKHFNNIIFVTAARLFSLKIYVYIPNNNQYMYCIYVSRFICLNGNKIRALSFGG